MYRSFFGLNKLPFKISPDLGFFYKQASREEIARALIYSIERGDGIIKIVGEVGVGKTTLLSLIAENLPPHFRKIYVNSPNLSPLDFLRFVCAELSLEVSVQANKSDLLKHLNNYLIEEYTQGRRVVMLVDEAQSMTLDTLEQVRLLGNLETQQDKLLQIVLFGQPELDVTLADIRIKPLKDRIACNVYIPALDAEEVMRYLNYRMRVAGYLDQDLFNTKLSKKIQKYTKGLPRSINLVADKLLMIAFSQGSHVLKAKHFKSLDIEPVEVQPKSSRRWVLIVSIVLIVLALGYSWFLTQKSNPFLNILNLSDYSKEAVSDPLKEAVQKLSDTVNLSTVLMPKSYKLLKVPSKQIANFNTQWSLLTSAKKGKTEGRGLPFFEIRAANQKNGYEYGLLSCPSTLSAADLSETKKRLQITLSKSEVVKVTSSGNLKLMESNRYDVMPIQRDKG